MKRIIKVLSILFITTIILTACGKDKGSIVGLYNVYEIKQEDQVIDSASLQSWGYDFTLEMTEDNKFKMILRNESIDGTYDAKSIKYTVKEDDKEEQREVNYTYSNNTITLTKDGIEMKFKKN